jgi:tetratricopeptide (TPR) repeat protein
MVESTNGNIIITSRLKNWNEKTELDLFSENESIEFLEKKTGIKDVEKAKLLANKLDNFPLALEQAGAYIKNDSSYDEYIEFYDNDENRLDILNDEKPDEYHSTIAKTWNISINKISSQVSKDLLNVISFFAPNKIPVRIFEEGKECLPNSIKTDIENKFKAKKIYKELDKYSLIRCENNYISIHKLLQEVIRLTIEHTNWYKYAFDIVYNSFNYDYNNQATWEASIEIVPHILSITDYTYNNGFEKENTAYLFNEVAFLYYNQGKYEEAEPLYIQSLKIYEKVLGASHPNTKIIRGNLDDLLKKINRS